MSWTGRRIVKASVCAPVGLAFLLSEAVILLGVSRHWQELGGLSQLIFGLTALLPAVVGGMWLLLAFAPERIPAVQLLMVVGISLLAAAAAGYLLYEIGCLWLVAGAD